MQSLVFDIETEPLSDEELQAVYQPPESRPHPGDFDESAVKYGNTKDEQKRAEKLAEARAKHEAEVAGHEQKELERLQGAWADFKDKAALSATTGRVLVVGIIDVTGKWKMIEGDEPDVLGKAWRDIDTIGQGGKLIGFNCHGFDLPFMIRRSWLHGIAPPAWVLPRPWFDLRIIDLYREWQLADRGMKGKLDDLCKFFQVPGKLEGCDGGMFAELYHSEPLKAREYMEKDLRATLNCAAKMQVI